MAGEFDEQALIHSAQGGDPEAFNLLIDRYQGMMFRIALRMLGDADEAEDAAQVAWISAFRNLNAFRGGQLRTWLARVVVNSCYDEIRRRHRRREIPLMPAGKGGEELETPYWLEDPAPSVEARIEAREFERNMDGCLQSLTPVYRSMLVLVDIEGLTYEEAALAARVPIGTVRSRLARARMALRERLQESGALVPALAQSPLQPAEQARARVL